MLREQKGAHVCGQRCFGYGRVRLCEHFGPCAHVYLIDIVNNVFETELNGEIRTIRLVVKIRTLIIALVTKL
jgi:hypothetical protein